MTKGTETASAAGSRVPFGGKLMIDVSETAVGVGAASESWRSTSTHYGSGAKVDDSGIVADD